MNSKTKILFIIVVFSLVSFMLGKHSTFIIKTLGFASQGDFDLDGIPDSIDKYPFDYDNDGMPDIWEKRNGLRYDADDANEDYDNDGITNIDEYRQGTNPWVSDKTGERVEQVLFSPVEKRIVKSTVWIGAAIFVFLLIALILFRKEILRIFLFIYHGSKEHFEKRKAPFRPVPTGRPVFYPRYYPRYRMMPPKRRFIQPIQRRPMETTKAPIMPSRTGVQPMERLSERSLEEQYIPKPKETVIKETERKPEVVIPSEKKPYPIKEEPFERVADFVKEEKHDDVFERIRKISSKINVK